jgi:hypothetical protein
VVERSIAVFTLVKLVGAAYLIYLGVQTFRHRGSLVDAFRAGVAVKPRRQIMREGFGGRPHRLRFVGGAGGAATVGLGVRLTRRHD